MTAPTSTFVPPAALVDAILRGRCIAFVGAGFAAGVMPGWGSLLTALAARLHQPIPKLDSGNALHNEAMGQWLKDKAGSEWESHVRAVLEEHVIDPHRAIQAKADLEKRRTALLSIPFKAILTTNFDASLTGGPSLGPAQYAEVLREERGRWWGAPDHGRPTPPILKLHGDANGRADQLPVVLGRTDYRNLMYGNGNYANFIRAAFAEYTVLFLGVSFTDAYLNELRSEVLNLVHHPEARTPWGYAVVNDPAEWFTAFLRKDEGIEVLPTTQLEQFVEWLEAIAHRTSIEGRLKELLGGKRVLWVDPEPDNNLRGRELLAQTGFVTTLGAAAALDETLHNDADLILTSFGKQSGVAFEVLERVSRWHERPPVIVFASNATAVQLADNRRQCLRRGAWEYTTAWSELYRAIELVLDRVPGTATAY